MLNLFVCIESEGVIVTNIKLYLGHVKVADFGMCKVKQCKQKIKNEIPQLCFLFSLICLVIRYFHGSYGNL